MVYKIRVIDQKGITKFESEFDKARHIDLEKLKQKYQERYPKDKVEVR